MTNPPRSERPDMAGYGVTDDPEGLLPWSWAEERLVGCRNFWFVTVRPDGRPHSMPVWGVWMPERQRWGLGCATTAQKVANMTANPAVVVTIEDTVEVVSVEGTATQIEPGDAAPFIEAWVDKYAVDLDVVDDTTREQAREFLRQGAIFEIKPVRAYGLIERAEEFSTAATRWAWD